MNFGRQGSKLRVHHQDAFAAHLHRGVAARAHQHVDVVLHGLHVDLHVVEILLLAIALREAQNSKRGND